MGERSKGKDKGKAKKAPKAGKPDKRPHVQLKEQHQKDAAKITSVLPIEPLIAHVSPPIASLPPLEKGATVDAMDLANHYLADSASASSWVS